jgi:hypothetical protein
MPFIRFRIRTIMLVIGLAAILMAVFTYLMRLAPWMQLLPDPLAVVFFILNGMISYPLVTFLAVAVFVSLVQCAVFWDRFRSSQRKPGRFSTKAYRSFARPQPDRLE